MNKVSETKIRKNTCNYHKSIEWNHLNLIDYLIEIQKKRQSKKPWTRNCLQKCFIIQIWVK